MMAGAGALGRMWSAASAGGACARAAPLLLIAAITLGATPALAQVFMATRPNPEFEIGPLFVRASVGPELGPVSIDVLWSLAVPPTRSALGLEQDLYLLWPAALRGEDRTSDDGRLEEYLRSRGFAVTGKGQLPLSSRISIHLPMRRERPADRRRAVRAVPPRRSRGPGSPADGDDRQDPMDARIS